jgi:exopolyphosphatase/guanosine-5'-triphosphate,3'-diphosphate pyrophosphatase
VHDVADRLLAMTRADRAALPFMHPGRVDVIGAGALVLAVLLENVPVDDVVVSEHDILDGIAWSVVEKGAS